MPDESNGTGARAVLVDRLRSLELGVSQSIVYDRPIGLRLLYEDPQTGAEHYLVHYPAGLRGKRHRHTASHTVVVLEGALLANGEILEAGSYAHFAGGALMRHEPAPGSDCLFVIIFDGPFDVETVAEGTE
jgi:quercetin dioxygenase-like cupin family protein